MLARPRLHQRGKLRMAGAEIGGIAQFRVLQPVLQRTVAVGAEGLRRRLHRTCALMFAVAVDAGTLRRLAECGGHSRQQLVAQSPFSPCHGDAGGRCMVVRIPVAGLAGAVADRDERLLMAGFAAAFEGVVGLAERTG